MDTTAGGSAAAERVVAVLLAVIAGWLSSLGLGTATALADDPTDPPVLTESFESVPGLPGGWRFSEYTKGNSEAAILSGAAADGTHFLRIASSKLNHARVVVPVKVIPNTSYRFQVMVKARDANPELAAVLGLDGQYTATDSVRTDAQWQPLELYVKVGPQSTIDLTMGLGHFGQLNVGTAEFDAVTLTQVSAIPNGATVVDLGTPAKPATANDSTSTQGPSRGIWVFVGILVLVGAGAAVFLMLRADTKSTPEVGTAEAGIDSGPARLPDRAD